MGVWKRFSENFRFCMDCNFDTKCPFLIILGLFESLCIDLCNGTGPIKKYFLSSEIWPIKVVQISEKSWKSHILRLKILAFQWKSWKKCSNPQKSKNCDVWQKVFYARYRSSIVRATSYLVGIILYTFFSVKKFILLKFWFLLTFFDGFWILVA